MCFKNLCILTYVMYPLLYYVVRVTALKIALCFPYLAHSSSSGLLATTDHFTVFADLPFPECHIIGIIQYVAFSDWLLVLSTMLPSFIHVFCGLMLIYLYCQINCGISQFIHLPIEDILVVSSFGGL